MSLITDLDHRQMSHPTVREAWLYGTALGALRLIADGRLSDDPALLAAHFLAKLDELEAVPVAP